MTHFADRQCRPRRVVTRRAVTIDKRGDAGNVAEPVGAKVVAGRDQRDARHAAGSSGIDALDLSMGEIRAQHHSVRHARERDVVGIAAAPANQTQILMAPHRLSDTEFHGDPRWRRRQWNSGPVQCQQVNFQ